MATVSKATTSSKVTTTLHQSSPKVRKKVTLFNLVSLNMQKKEKQQTGSNASSVPVAGPSKKKSVFSMGRRGHHKQSKSPYHGGVLAGRVKTNYFYEKLLAEGYSEDELDDYIQVFSLFDTDTSGAIGTTELGKAMESMGLNVNSGELQNLIQEVDQDGNGEIDFQEFCGVMRRMTSKRKNVSWDDIIKQCFEVFDRSGSGTITEEDFRAILSGLGEIRNERVIEDIFSEFDVDGNKMIDYAEFSNLVKHYMTEEDIESYETKD